MPASPVTADASGIKVPLTVPYSVTGPVFTQPTPYPMFIAGSTQEMALIIYASQPVNGVRLTLPPGFTTRGSSSLHCSQAPLWSRHSMRSAPSTANASAAIRSSE